MLTTQTTGMVSPRPRVDPATPRAAATALAAPSPLPIPRTISRQRGLDCPLRAVPAGRNINVLPGSGCTESNGARIHRSRSSRSTRSVVNCRDGRLSVQPPRVCRTGQSVRGRAYPSAAVVHVRVGPGPDHQQVRRPAAQHLEGQMGRACACIAGLRRNTHTPIVMGRNLQDPPPRRGSCPQAHSQAGPPGTGALRAAVILAGTAITGLCGWCGMRTARASAATQGSPAHSLPRLTIPPCAHHDLLYTQACNSPVPEWMVTCRPALRAVLRAGQGKLASQVADGTCAGGNSARSASA